MTKIIVQTLVSRALQQRLQLRVATNFLSKMLTIRLTKRIDARSASNNLVYQVLDLFLTRLRDAELFRHLVQGREWRGD